MYYISLSASVNFSILDGGGGVALLAPQTPPASTAPDAQNGDKEVG